MQDKQGTIERAARIMPPLLLWLLVAIAFGNAFAYVHTVSNPLVTEDNWTFLDTFLTEAISGRLDFGDFLVKRSGFDHGQPLNKLAMWIHYRWFGLDFSVEAKIGLACALLAFLLMYRMAVADAGGGPRRAAFCMAMAAVAAVHVSLNASYLYQFPLVTLGHVAHLLLLLTFYTAWRALRGGSLAVFAATMLAMAVAGDMSAVLSGATLVLVCAWYGLRTGRRREAWRIAWVVLLALLAARAVYWGFGTVRGTTQAVFNVPMSEHLAGLRAGAGEAWKWVVVPLVSGLAVAKQLQAAFPTAWSGVQLATGVVLGALHLWFWRAAFREQPRAARFLAVCLMLSFYSYVAGVVYGRVFARGAGYLDQQRYVLFYQLHVVALLLMAAARQLESPSGTAPRSSASLLAAAVLVIALQLPLSFHSWAAAPAIVAHHRAEAAQYGRMARDPAQPVSCGFSRRLCTLPAAERRRIVAMLRDHRLGLHSLRFADAHPDLVRAAALPAP